jgi:hypothetical protein
MKNVVKKLLKEETKGLFSESWYLEVSGKIIRAIKSNKKESDVDGYKRHCFEMIGLCFEKGVKYTNYDIQQIFISNQIIESAKKRTLLIQEYCKINNIRLEKICANGVRSIILY